MKTIIITLDINDGNKKHDEEHVKAIAGYFLEDAMNALQDIHGINTNSIKVEIK